MKLQRLNLAKIKVPETRVTAVYDEETAELLRKSLEAAGTINPIIVVSSGEDYLIVDGLHRLEEARARGDTHLEAVVYEGEQKDALLMNLVLNKVRGKTKASEMVQVIGSLFNDFNMDSDQIGEKTGLTRDYIEKLLKISTASPSVQEALDQEIIGVGHAFELSRLPYAAQQEEVIAKHQVWRFSIKDLREQVDGVLREMDLIKEQPAPSAGTQPRPAPVYHCEGCKTEAEPRYLRPVMLCPDCFGHVWRLGKAAEKVEEKIEEDKGGV